MPTLLCALVCAAGLTTHAQAVVVFEDNFNSHSIAPYSFSGDNLATWAASGNKLQTSLVQSAHTGLPGFAAINGLVTTNHFKIEADVQVAGPNERGADFGHVGMFWGKDRHAGRREHRLRAGQFWGGQSAGRPGRQGGRDQLGRAGVV